MQVVTEAAQVLLNGGIIAMPTDTIYGLACLSNSAASVQRLYDTKTRPDNKPIAVCLAHPRELKYWVDTDHLPSGILDELLPGPVTIILELLKNSTIDTQRGLTRLGVRVPGNEFSRKLAAAIPGNIPIALTSANCSGERSSLKVEEFKELWPKIDLIIDGGEIIPIVDDVDKQRTGSTVIDLSIPGKFTIVRYGMYEF